MKPNHKVESLKAFRCLSIVLIHSDFLLSSEVCYHLIWSTVFSLWLIVSFHSNEPKNSINSSSNRKRNFLTQNEEDSNLTVNNVQQKLNDKNNKMYANLSRNFDCKYFIHAKRVKKSFYGDFSLPFILLPIYSNFDSPSISLLLNCNLKII